MPLARALGPFGALEDSDLDDFNYLFGGIRMPYVTIHTTAGWSDTKNWHHRDGWKDLVEKFHDYGYAVVQIGSSSEPKVEGVDIFAAEWTTEFIDHVLLQAGAHLHVGVDSVFSHTSAIRWNGKRVPAVILWGSTNPEAFGYPHQTHVKLDLPCQPCYLTNECFHQREETFDRVCTRSIGADLVFRACTRAGLKDLTKENMPDPVISATIIAKNEETCILECLDSVSEADEIVVYDTGSTDQTKDLVRSFNHPNVKLVDGVWDDHFAKARNAALDEATGDWCLIIDCDEVVEPGTIQALKNQIGELQEGQATLRFECRPKTGEGVHHMVRAHARLPYIRWEGRVHEALNVDDRILCPGAVLRYGYSPAHNQDPDRVLRLLLKDVFDCSMRGVDTGTRTLYYLGREYWYRSQFRKAAEVFEQRVQNVGLRSECADAWIYLARCYWQMGEGDKAREAVLKSLLLAPDCKEAHLLMAELSFPEEAEVWTRLASSATNKNVLFVRCS